MLVAVTGALLVASLVSLARSRSPGAWMQLAGALALVVVGLVHVCEGLGLFPAMGWGHPDSPGHYLDLTSAVAGVVLTPAGFLLRRAGRRREQPGRRESAGRSG